MTASSRGKPSPAGRRIDQLDETWNLYDMTSNRLLKLLPKEFDRFRPKTAASA
jgi:hypothetical protein